ncbi:unnamed protein product [Cylindrotheca closterium]|uniref:Uncharacterized protein n=1 Tax=Cylindrotheca closterium TaxID=2856 RepID=A0AAD2GAH6_9STRA|nr:unnamed protein product [Cylindrotheca closterium]
MSPPKRSLEGTRLETPLGNSGEEARAPHNPPRPDDDLPSNICDSKQLVFVPQECLSGNHERPLLHVDASGRKSTYSLQPMQYSVMFILMVELLERFSYYGYCYTLTLYLTGAYNEDWNAGFESVKAASFVSLSTMVAYTTPFIGAILADSVLGDYRSILFGLLCFYVPGVSIFTLTSVPGFFGEEFNESLLLLSLVVLWPLGTGIVKSIVNVFGAKQFHPLLQSSLIEAYYVKFYMAINIGSMVGICSIPILAQHNVTMAYCVPLCLLLFGATVFISGTPRYVRAPPSGNLFRRKRVRKTAQSIPLSSIFRICLLIVPFSTGYNQMPTTFIVQGAVMTKAFGFIDVASMNSLDAISVLFFGSITSTYIYPYLASRGIKLPTTYKFAIGSGLGALGMCWALVVERMIHAAYEKDGSQICVLWQAPAYILIGWGEIFAVSAAYEVAFKASSPDKKALASATNIFCVGGLPNILCIMLYHFCSPWFENSHGTTAIGHIDEYATAKIGNYFCVLLGVMLFGVGLNLLPSVRDFVDGIENQSVDILKTPIVQKGRGRRNGGTDENTALLTPGSKRYQDYMKFGDTPVLYKMGSMRAGASLSNSDIGHTKPMKYKYVPKIYQSVGELGDDGKPIKDSGAVKGKQKNDLGRLNST